jgi:hypothetical protein
MGDTLGGSGLKAESLNPITSSAYMCTQLYKVEEDREVRPSQSPESEYVIG